MNSVQVDKVDNFNEADPTSIWQFKIEQDNIPALYASSCFFNWELLYPQLRLLLKNIEIIKQEAKSIPKVILKGNFIRYE